MAENVASTGTSARSGLKAIVAIAVAVVILIVASTASVLVVGQPSPASFAAGTPQAAFQKWLVAANAGDWTIADGYLSSNLVSQGVVSQQLAGSSSGPRATVSIDGVQMGERTATLSITIDRSLGSGIGAAGYSTSSTVQMVLENGAWKLDSQSFGLY